MKIKFKILQLVTVLVLVVVFNNCGQGFKGMDFKPIPSSGLTLSPTPTPAPSTSPYSTPIPSPIIPISPIPQPSLGPAPSYISNLQPFEVRKMTGAYAPADGKESILSITPPDWDPYEALAVIIAWNGGAKATSGTKLIVHGGGHNDGANNGMYIFDYAELNGRPRGWVQPLNISRRSDVPDNSTNYGATYLDGKAPSVHTYDGMTYAGHNNFIYRFAGAIWSASGGFTAHAYKFDVSSGIWTQLPDGNPGGASTMYDPVSKNIFVIDIGHQNGRFFRTSTDTWSGNKNLDVSGGVPEGTAAWDTRRNRGIVLGNSAGTIYGALININFSNETVTASRFSPAGATEILANNSGVSAVYDSVRDSYWIFGGRNTNSSWGNIYEVPAAGNPWTIIRHPLATPIETLPAEMGMRGSFGRLVFMEQWRAIGMVHTHNQAPLVIKLPD